MMRLPSPSSASAGDRAQSHDRVAPGRLKRAWESFLDALPRGRTLPDEVWLARHRALLALLWLHAVGLTIFALAEHDSVLHSFAHGAVLAVIASCATLAHGNRRMAAAFVSVGLITSSALLVHIWGGVIEGHFHFFVMIALLALYEDWFPFLLAAAYVVVHHGLVGVLDAHGVYNHPDAVQHPWKWALIHGAFVVAAGTASVVTWRLNENVRAETQAAYRRARESEARFKGAFEDAPNGMVLATIEPDRAGRFLQVNRAMCELTGYGEEELLGKRFSDITHPDDLDVSVALKQRMLAGELSRYQITKRYLHPDGHAVWVQVHMSLVRDSSGNPMYTIAQIEDITERKRVEESVQRSSRQLAEAQKLAQIGSWEWSPLSGEATRSDELYRIFGWDPGVEVPALEAFLELVHPDEREHVRETLEASVANCEPFRFEARIVRADGATRIIESYGEVVAVVGGRAAKLVGTVQDVTERRQVEEELVRRREAEREHKARSEFLSRISHELRTPMNSILGFAQLLEMDELTEAQHENVELISKGGHHLLQLINEVLEISRIESGNLTVSVEPVHVESTVAEVLDLVRPLAAEHGVALENRLADDGDHHVAADHQRLKQVLLNLLSNAIKYNRQGGSVRISLEAPAPERVLVLVTDTGRGIPEDKLAHVFSPFDRLGAEQTTIEGTGLGLTLSKHLVEAMGGTLGVESEPWIGSTFIVGLAAADGSGVAAQERFGEMTPASGNGAMGAATVLYVEDNLSNFKLVEKVLKRRGEVRLLTAMEGALGLQLAHQHRPDLILLDLHLPGMDGEELLRRLNEDPVTAAIPVLVVSADATRVRVERVLTAGARAFVTKPIDIERFLVLVDDALRENVGV
jgi:PAS domain S-box-containing protein